MMSTSYSKKRSDPSNAFHELRRYLLSMGIATRVNNFVGIPLPVGLNQTRDKSKRVVAGEIGTVDNSFIFELRRIFDVDSTRMNAVVFLVRVFFDKDQGSKSFHMQMVANHKGHGILEMNRAYHDILCHLDEQGWTQVPHSDDIYALEKRFESIQEFKAQFDPIYELLHKHNVLNDHGLSSQMQM